MVSVKNCLLPEGLLYDVDNDVWAKEFLDGSIKMGITDVGQTAVGKIRYVSFPKSNQDRKVQPNKSLALLESAKWVGPIRSPEAGIVLARNEELLEHPLLVNLEPYGKGWVIHFMPDKPLNWLREEAAIEAYKKRLSRTFRSVAGVNDDFWCIHCNDWDEV